MHAFCAGVSENDVDNKLVHMELNPSYVALAEVYTHDSSISTANVHLQANPSYVALPMMVQGQDVVLCGPDENCPPITKPMPESRQCS